MASTLASTPFATLIFLSPLCRVLLVWNPSLQKALQEIWTALLIMSMLLAPFTLILLNLSIVVLLMVVILRGFPLRFGILIEILLLIVLHKVSIVTL